MFAGFLDMNRALARRIIAVLAHDECARSVSISLRPFLYGRVAATLLGSDSTDCALDPEVARQPKQVQSQLFARTIAASDSECWQQTPGDQVLDLTHGREPRFHDQ